MLEYLKLKYGDFLLIDIVYENGPIKFFCISAVFMLDVSIDTGLTTFLHLISLSKYSRFVVFDVFDRLQYPAGPVRPARYNSTSSFTVSSTWTMIVYCSYFSFI